MFQEIIQDENHHNFDDQDINKYQMEMDRENVLESVFGLLKQ